MILFRTLTWNQRVIFANYLLSKHPFVTYPVTQQPTRFYCNTPLLNTSTKRHLYIYCQQTASWAYFILANVVVGRTLLLRLERLSDHHAQQLQQAKTAAEEGSADITLIRQQSSIVEDLISLSEKDKPSFNLAKGEKPPAGKNLFISSITVYNTYQWSHRPD